MRRPATVLLLAVLGVAAASGCSGGAEDPAPASAPVTADAPPLSAYDTKAVAVARSPFCDRVTGSAVSAALGGDPARSREWSPGEPLAAQGVDRDVADEYGCEWITEEGLAATAWLFAPPVTRARARALLADAPRCWSAEGESFGTPSAAIRCGPGERGVPGDQPDVVLGYRGLFGDAWLSCSLSATGGEEPPDLPKRAEQWCVQVLEAVRVR